MGDSDGFKGVMLPARSLDDDGCFMGVLGAARPREGLTAASASGGAGFVAATAGAASPGKGTAATGTAGKELGRNARARGPPRALLARGWSRSRWALERTTRAKMRFLPYI
ncbi:hypothetical protein BS78_08G155600 [Paspalum vaginatum]|nr:hypothetical protein BS78_08G155600 [Paspalum vaginatum]